MTLRHARFLAPLVAIALLALVFTVSGCSAPSQSGTGGTGGGGTTVVEKGFKFVPATLTVQVGDTVKFDNQDAVPHHVFVGPTDLGEQAPGASVSWTASTDGTFPVKCSIHASMTGQITVGAGGATSPPPAGGTSTPPASTGGY
jgi:plastocyanin